jgi:hypothetical protein
MSLWRKRNVCHDGQNTPKWFNMTALADNDLSIKSEDLSIKSWVGLTDEEIGMAFRAVFPVGGVVFTNGATEFAKTIERKLKEKNP